MLTLRTLGVPRLDGPDGELLKGRRKELALLAYLARRGQAVSREVLADLLWGSRPDANARQSLRQALVQLKRAVPDGLDADAEAVALAPGVLALDATLFEADLSAGHMESAVARWHGDFLTGCDDIGSPAFGTWLDAERQGLRARLETAFATLVDLADRNGNAAAVLEWATRWADTFPHDEEAAAHVVRALHRVGRGAEAIARHAAFAARLRRDMEREPTPAFARLVAAISEPRSPARPTPASGALFTPELVGRAPALDALRRAWTSAGSGTSTLVLIEGDEGIGKTRLCEEFLQTLPAGSVVLRTRGNEADRDAPHAALGELLAGLHEVSGLAGAGAAALAVVGDLVPSIRERFPRGAAGERSVALTDAVTDVLGAVAAEAPMLVLVDDVPWIDDESRDVLLAVARRLRHAPVCFVLTARSDDIPGEVLAELRGRVGETRIRLGPLSESDVELVMASMLEMAPEERGALARRLHTESAGNPLYLIETTATLLDEGRLTVDDRGVWHAAGGLAETRLPVPPTVRAAARRRLEALSPEAVRVAGAAAVLARLAIPRRLVQLTQLTDDEVDGALEELQLRRVLRGPAKPDGAYEFAHEVTRRAALAALSGTRRRRLHARAVQVLRAATPQERDVTPEVLAYHRRRAGGLGGRLPPWLGVRASAAIVVGVVAVAFLVRGLLGGSATGFAERDWVILTDLNNATGDSIFDQSLTAALFVSISQSQHVNVFPPTRIRETLRRMRIDSVPHMTESLAREVAEREGIRAVVTLAIASEGDAYTLTSRVVDPESGRTLATLTAAATGRDHVLAALDHLAGDLRRTLGESARAVRARSVFLPQATTSSLEALKLFAQGNRALDDGRIEEGTAALRAAIALDSNFAWAQAELGRYLDWVNDPDLAAPHLARALALADRLPERERLWVQRLVAQGRKDRVEAIRLARQYLSEYPDDPDAWFSLGRTLQEAGDQAGALAAYQRLLEIDPQAPSARVNSGVLHYQLGQPVEAVADIDRVAAGDSTIVTQVAGDLNRIYGFAILSTGDSARARAVFERLLGGNPSQVTNGLRSLALANAYYGRYHAAVARLTDGIRLCAAQPHFRLTEFRNRLYLAGMYETMGRLPDARREVRIADSLHRAGVTPLPWMALLGQRQARTGLVEDADRVLAEMLARQPAPATKDGRAAIALVQGEVALARGDDSAAVEAFTQAVELNAVDYTRQGLARALVAAGRPSDAVPVYQALLRDSTLGWEGQEPWVLAHYELATVYDRLGDSAAARPLYEKLAALWRRGDGDLPVLRAIRRRLATKM